MRDASLSRRIETFNRDWRFARFGPMPDGSLSAEPGGPRGVFQLSASSEADGRPVELAMNGDTADSWLASSPDLPQWVRIDMGKVHDIGRVSIIWGLQEEYGFLREYSLDGETWSEEQGAARYIRIRVTATPGEHRAAIRTIRLYDTKGRELRHRQVAVAQSPAAPDFDDSSWRRLDLPHDWGIEGPFRYDIEGCSGRLPWRGIGWYRKRFALPASGRGQRVFIECNGAMSDSQVWLNGESVGGWPYGYQAFQLELTPFVKFGEDNVIAVRLDTTTWGARWYPGAGIYRNVRLVITAPVHVAHRGVRVTTPSITASRGETAVAVTVDNQSAGPMQASVQVEILDEAGKVAESAPVVVGVAPGGSAQAKLQAAVTDPVLWDTENPCLYTARTTVRLNGKVVDSVDTTFGFRTLEFTPRDGFKLNGRRVEVRGTCNHHDLGALGSAMHRRALERQLAILQAMGCNALRTSHNPPAPELAELADRMGFLIQCEAFDSWRTGKMYNDYYGIFDGWHERDLRAMVAQFANHPSVFMWSIGNEVVEQFGPETAAPLAAIVHDEDPTRPVTAGCNNSDAAFNGFQNAVDVFGMNYNIGAYGKIRSFPGNEERPLHGSETSSCTSSRGEYFFPVERGGASQVDFHVSSYDVDGPGWFDRPDEQFAALEGNPDVFGEFVWTGFDYLGEPTPYNDDATQLHNFSDPARRAAMEEELKRLGKIRMPSRSSYFGIIDLAGFPKDRYYSYQAHWRPELPMAHIFPHWNWPERVGQVTPVHVYTSGNEAELFLNGQSLGRQKKGEFVYRLRWDDAIYQPGELKVVAYRNGKEWAWASMKTTGEPARVTLTPDRSTILADGLDLSFVTVCIADREGLTVPRTDNLVTFSIEGPGEIVAVDNGNPVSFESFQSDQRKAFNGLALVIVRAHRGQAGNFKVIAVSDGLHPASVMIAST